MQNHFNYNIQLDDIMQLVNYQNQPLANVTNANKIEKKLPPLRQRVKENSRLLPQRAIDIMTEWYDKHYEHPYPTYREFELLAERGLITVNQVKQWFVNVRRRTQNAFRKKRDSDKQKKQNIPVNYSISELSQPTTPSQDLNVQYEIQKDIQAQIRNYQDSLLNKSNDTNINHYKPQPQALNESTYTPNSSTTAEQFNESYSNPNTASNESISYESTSSNESPSIASAQSVQYPANCNYYGYYPFYYNNSPLNNYYNQSYRPVASYSSYQSTPSSNSSNYSSSYETSPTYNYSNYNSSVEVKIEPTCSTPVSANTNLANTNSYYSNYYYNGSNSYNNCNISQSY